MGVVLSGALGLLSSTASTGCAAGRPAARAPAAENMVGDAGCGEMNAVAVRLMGEVLHAGFAPSDARHAASLVSKLAAVETAADEAARHIRRLRFEADLVGLGRDEADLLEALARSMHVSREAFAGHVRRLAVEGLATDAAVRDMIAASCTDSVAAADCIAARALEATRISVDWLRTPDVDAFAKAVLAGRFQSPSVRARAAAVGARVTAYGRVLAESDRAARRELDRLDLTPMKRLVANTRERCPNLDPAAVPTFAADSVPGSWRVDPKPDVAKLTVLVRAAPTAALAERFLAMAERTTGAVSEFYKGNAEGAFGSGFVLVHERQNGRDALVVTNRHVIDLADLADVVVQGAPAAPGIPARKEAHFAAEILFTDPRYDLAVLKLPDEALKSFEGGFALGKSPAHDGDRVRAIGYPGVREKPLYRVTEGEVTNDHVVLSMAGRPLRFVQHSALIDPGSSGGPLTTTDSIVLAVNTLKIKGPVASGLSIPATAVEEAAANALEAKRSLDTADSRRAGAKQACLALIGELASDSPRVEVLEPMIGNRLVAEQGFASMITQLGRDEVRQHYIADPALTLRHMVVERLVTETRSSGSIHSLELCSAARSEDWQNVMNADRVRFVIQTRARGEEITLGWEQGRWKLVASSLFKDAPLMRRGRR